MRKGLGMMIRKKYRNYDYDQFDDCEHFDHDLRKIYPRVFGENAFVKMEVVCEFFGRDLKYLCGTYNQQIQM